MNRLIAELQRLYFPHDQQWLAQKPGDGGEPAFCAAGVSMPAVVANSLAGVINAAYNLVGPNGTTQAMVMNFERAGDWARVASLYRAVQNELDLPAPAVSVSGYRGYGIWFSLAEPVPVAQARAFLLALHRKYLADIPMPDLEFHPTTAAPSITRLVPSLHMASGKWSAYIDPSLCGMFIDEPWLEMAPNMAKQADILAGLESIKAGVFQKALTILQTQAATDANPGLHPIERPADLPGEAAGQPASGATRTGLKLNVGNDYRDPESFLLAVMNDPSASTRQRIRAAKALLPYFVKAAPG